MKKTLWLLISLAIILPQTAYAQLNNSIFELLVNSKKFDSNDTYIIGSKAKGNVAEIEVYFPDAVQLDVDVPSDIIAKLPRTKVTALPANTVFYAADNQKSIYCTQALNDLLQGLQDVCLIDRDHDGHFEEISKARDNTKKPPLLLQYFGGLPPNDLASKKVSTAIGGLLVVQGVFFSKPLTYHHISPSDLPKSSMYGQIFATSDYNKNSQDPVRFTFSVGLINEAYASLYSEYREVTFSGTPVSVDLYGITITVIGVDKKGNPICKLDGQIDHKILPFLLQNITWTIRYY